MKRMTVLVSTLLCFHLAISSFASSHTPSAKTAPGVVWFDLMVTDLADTEKFYGSLFGWKVKPLSTDYYMVESGGVPIGGIQVKSGTASGDGITIYFEVEDVQVKLTEAKTEGASVILKPKNLPSGKGSFALFRDLEGNPIGLISKKSI